MLALWERMSQFFGKKWEENYGTVEQETIWAWQGALNRFSEDELAYAVRAIEREFRGGFVPTWPEFRDICEAGRSAVAARQARLEAEPKPEVPLMEHLKRNAITPIAKRELERMQRILAGEDVETKRESWEKLGLSKTRGPLPEGTK